MENIFPIIFVWLILAIPVFFLAYAIFLVRENKATKYAAIYGRALLMFVLFAAIVGGYIFIPYLMGGSSGSPEYAVEGVYFEKASGDTINFRNGTMTIRGKSPANNITGNFSVVQNNGGFQNQFEAGLWALIKEPYYNNNRGRMLTISWVDSSAYKKAIAKTSNKKKPINYADMPKYRSATWQVETKTENELILSPVYNNNSGKRFLTKL